MATDNTNIVSALNAGSGINIKQLAQALVDAEKVPRESLVQSKIDKSSAKISGLGIVKNVLERFKGSFQKLDSAASRCHLGAMSTLEADLAKSATRVISHMNDDHADSLLAYAAFYGGMRDAPHVVRQELGIPSASSVECVA